MTLISFPDMLAAADKIWIYCLVHPLIESEVKYVGATLKPKDIISSFTTKKSNVARWVKYLCRMNTEPEIVILQEVNISEDKKSWRANKRWWIEHFRSKDCELLNHKLKQEKLTTNQRSEVLSQVRRFAWTDERRAKQREIYLRLLADGRRKLAKKYEAAKLADKVLRNERYRVWLSTLNTRKR